MTNPRAPRRPVAFILDRRVSLTEAGSDSRTVPVDVVETAAGWRLVFEVPGAIAEKTVLEVKERVVVVRGERRATDGEGGVFLRLERATGPFERALELPEEADPERATAFYQDGLLVLQVPRRTRTRGRQIPIRPGKPEAP